MSCASYQRADICRKMLHFEEENINAVDPSIVQRGLIPPPAFLPITLRISSSKMHPTIIRSLIKRAVDLELKIARKLFCGMAFVFCLIVHRR